MSAILQFFFRFVHFLHLPSSTASKLPKLDVAGSIPVSRSIFLNHSGKSPKAPYCICTALAVLHHSQTVRALVYTLPAPFDRRDGIDISVHPDPLAELVRNRFGILASGSRQR